MHLFVSFYLLNNALICEFYLSKTLRGMDYLSQKHHQHGISTNSFTSHRVVVTCVEMWPIQIHHPRKYPNKYI